MTKTGALAREGEGSKFQDVFTGLGLLEGDYHLQVKLESMDKRIRDVEREVKQANTKD